MTNHERTTGERTKDATVLMLGGAGFLLLAGGFLWRDLALPAEAVLLVAALAALAATLFQLPRRWPVVPPVADPGDRARRRGAGSWR